MNILIPHSWLLEHLDTDATPAEIQQFVSLCGPSIERIYEREGEPVYDVEITTNRVDSMSVRGIAREAAVILQQFGKKAKLKPLSKSRYELSEKDLVHPTESKITRKLPLPQILNDEQLCKRTLAVVLSGVQRAPTPKWMAKRLKQIEGNVHDAVIDITNYVTHELGHPCHAFDYDRIMELGGMIIIKTAAAGKKFTTLDGITYTTVGGEVVFENSEGEIIDLPGIKGTANTSINEQTTNVLFWLENTEASKIRFASMSHAIRTVAAQLNEKNVDPHLALPVLEAGIVLFKKITHAHQASAIYDDFPQPTRPPTISVPLQRIHDYLGIDVPLSRIEEILEALECTIDLKAQKLLVTPPTFRPDLQIPADVIEEIARIYGYHNLPSVVMPTAIPLNKPVGTDFHFENRIKRFLSDIGWQEVYTYSMVSEALAAQSPFPASEHLRIQNPLTDDHVYMRRSLIPSLEEFLANNSQHKELSVFEVANIYTPRNGDLPDEVLLLAMVSGKKYREAKGDLEALLRQFFLEHVSIEPVTEGALAEKSALGLQSGLICIDGMTDRERLGKAKEEGEDKTKGKATIGKVEVLKNGHVAFVIAIEQLLRVAKKHPTYQPLPRTSEIIEDVTLTLPVGVAIGPLLTEMRSVSELITSVELKDVYERNFTLSLVYSDPKRHLSVEEIAPVRKKMVQRAEKKYGAKLVGKLA